MPDTTVTVTAGMPTTVTVTGGVADVSIDVQRGIPGPNSITTSTLSNLTGFISANGTTVSGATAGSTAATPSTLVLRNANGGGLFQSTSDDEETDYGLAVTSNYADAVNIIANTGTGVKINSTTGNHLNIGSAKLIVANNGDTTLTGTIAASNLSGANTGDQFTAVTSQRLIGRHAGGSGAAQEVTVGNGIEFSGSGIRRSALTGDVTATAGSNATTLASTIAGAKTFSGQTELTGQAATNSTSAMTLGLTKDFNDKLSHKLTALWNMSTSYTSGGGAQASASRGYWQLFYPNLANAFSGSYIDLLGIGLTNPGNTANSLNFGRRMVFRCAFVRATTNSSCQFICQFGRNIVSANTTQLATNKGFGFANVNGTITPFVCNGSTVTNGATFSDSLIYSVVAEFIPATSLIFYTVSSSGVFTQVSSITTGLPTGSSSSTQLDVFIKDTSGAVSGDGRFYVNETSFTQY